MKFYAVMVDETGCEFPAECDAPNEEAAAEYLEEQYPESQIAQLETLYEMRARERETYFAARRTFDY
jgi:hypothetical protein